MELLITILLLTVGVLGTLHLQQYAAMIERDLQYRIRASALIEDIVRKMDAAEHHADNFLTGFGAPPATTNCWQTNCGETQRHRFHLAHWKCRLGRWQNTSVCRTRLRTRGLLPYGDGEIQRGHQTLRIAVRWHDSRQQIQTLTHHYVPLHP